MLKFKLLPTLIYRGVSIVRILKFGENLACIIPKEMARALQLRENEEVDFFEIKPGVYVFVRKAKVAEMLRDIVEEKKPELLEKIERKEFISREDVELLKKLDKIKFAERIPYTVNKVLSKEEKEILSELIKKGVVVIYKGGKYSKTGVYDIPGKFYNLVKEEKKESREKLPPIEHLEKHGYLIVENENEAKNISQMLEKRIKAGQIVGTRGFDKRFYVAKTEWLFILDDKIKGLLKSGQKNILELKNALKIDEEACKVVLEIMNEHGDVIEKKRGYYELI